MKKTILGLIFIFLIMGCSSKRYYTLGDTSDIEAKKTYTKIIAIEKVGIPKYLKDSTIARQISPYQVELIKDANWLMPMQKHLTNVLISYLQKSLNNPNIYLYPWESTKETDKKISLKIKRFIAYNNEVILDASYQIKDLKSKANTTKLFSTKVETANDIESIMKAMERAYFKLSDNIKNEITK